MQEQLKSSSTTPL